MVKGAASKSVLDEPSDHDQIAKHGTDEKGNRHDKGDVRNRQEETVTDDHGRCHATQEPEPAQAPAGGGQLEIELVGLHCLPPIDRIEGGSAQSSYERAAAIGRYSWR